VLQTKVGVALNMSELGVNKDSLWNVFQHDLDLGKAESIELREILDFYPSVEIKKTILMVLAEMAVEYGDTATPSQLQEELTEYGMANEFDNMVGLLSE